MKTAILVVSFGTTHLDTLWDNIARTETDIAAAFPGCRMYRAFTSNIVRRRLKGLFDMDIDTVEDALKRIAADGYTQVVIQPTLLIPGEESHRLLASIQAAAGDLKVSVGRPLLCNEEDMDELIGILRESHSVKEDTVLVTMGHGTYHSANSLYEQLAQKMRTQTGMAMRLCTVEGTPSFEDVVDELTKLPQRRARLLPLLFVAGEHAKNDMAGEEPESLRSLLVSRGFEVACTLQGLGELRAVRLMFVQRAKNAAKAFEQ